MLDNGRAVDLVMAVVSCYAATRHLAAMSPRVRPFGAIGYRGLGGNDIRPVYRGAARWVNRFHR